MNNNSPVGVFDSGVGGLSVLRRIRDLLPHEDLVYAADLHHLPYGNKSPAFIEQRSLCIAGYFARQGVKAMVVACNSATVSAVQALRVHFPFPVIGIEPGVKPAVLASRTGVVGILATHRTLASPAFAMLVGRFSRHCRVEVQACPGLVEQVERLELSGTTARQRVAGFVQPLLDKGVDTLVLGCTHYSFLSALIREVAGDGVTVIDTAGAVAREMERRLASVQLLSPRSRPGTEVFYTSGAELAAQQTISRLWGSAVSVAPLPREAQTARLAGCCMPDETLPA